MDWKIPATILILAFVVGLGVLPIFSPDFGSSLSSHFGSLDSAAGSLFQKTQTYEENVDFTMSVRTFPTISTTTPTTVLLVSEDKYDLLIDGKNMSIKGPVTLEEFVGNIDLAGGKINGNANGISSDNFDISGKSAINVNYQNFDEIKVSNLMIANFAVKDGTLNTKKPKEMSVVVDNLDDTKVYGFKGVMDYQNSTAFIAGTASMIKANGLTLGIEQIK